MDLKDPKTQKLALAVLGFFLVLYFWYSRVYSENDADLAMKRAKYESIMTELNAVELKAKSLDGLQREYEDLMQRYEMVAMLLPEENQVPKFLVQLHSAASITQSRLIEVEPLSTRKSRFYSKSEYQVKFQGTYHEFGEFLASIANFPFITNVSRIEINGLPVKSLASSKDKRQIHDARSLETSMVLTTYFVSPEDKFSPANQ